MAIPFKPIKVPFKPYTAALPPELKKLMSKPYNMTAGMTNPYKIPRIKGIRNIGRLNIKPRRYM